MPEVVVGYSRLRISLPLFVAEQRGAFERHGVRVRLQMYDTAQPLMQALVEGEIDAGGYTALPITFNAMLRSERALYFLTTMVEDQEHRVSYLLRRRTPEGATPEIASIADLRGHRVAILPTIAYRAWLDALLSSEGVDPSSVIVQQAAPHLHPALLQSGGVDALFTNDPAATSAIELGIAEPVNDWVEVPRVFGEPFPFGSFNVSRQWADEHPEPFAALVAALDEAVLYCNEHPDEAKELMRDYLPEVFRPHIQAYPRARYLPSWDSDEQMFSAIAARYQQMDIITGPIELSGLVVSGERPE